MLQVTGSLAAVDCTDERKELIGERSNQKDEVSERIEEELISAENASQSLQQEELTDSKQLPKGPEKQITQSVDEYSEILADDSAVENFFEKTQLLSKHLDAEIVQPPSQNLEHYVLGTIRDIRPG